MCQHDPEVSDMVREWKEERKEWEDDMDMVKHPCHYQSESGVEVIDVIEAFDLNFHLGNAIKYILRSGKKFNCKEDLEKAIWYISRHIENMQEGM